MYALQRKAVSRNRQNHTLAILSSRNINDFELWNAIKCHVTYVSAKRNHEACPQSVDLVWVQTNNKQYIRGTLIYEYQTMFKSDIWIGETTQCYRSFRLYLSNMCCYLLSSVPMELHPVVDKNIYIPFLLPFDNYVTCRRIAYLLYTMLTIAALYPCLWHPNRRACMQTVWYAMILVAGSLFQSLRCWWHRWKKSYFYELHPRLQRYTNTDIRQLCFWKVLMKRSFPNKQS